MEKEKIKGMIDHAKGAAKDVAGKVTGDEKLQAEGKLDKAKGTVEKAVGNAKGVLRDLRDN